MTAHRSVALTPACFPTVIPRPRTRNIANVRTCAHTHMYTHTYNACSWWPYFCQGSLCALEQIRKQILGSTLRKLTGRSPFLEIVDLAVEPHSLLFRRGTPSNSVLSIRLYRKPRESPAVGVGAPIELPSPPRSIGVSVRCYYR